MMRALEIKIKLPHLKLAAKRWKGTGAGKLLLIHGWIDNAASFDALLPRLEYDEAVAIDLAGHGLSDHRPPGVTYQFFDYIADLARVTKQLGWDEYSLIGHSMGGSLAMMMTLIEPEKVDKLVLLESIGPLSGTPQDEPARLRKSIKQMFELDSYKQRTMSFELAVRLRMRGSSLSKQAASMLVERTTIKTDKVYIWRHDPRLTQYYPIYPTEEQVLEYLNEITCPVLLIEAEDGLIRDTKQTQNRKDAIQQLQTVRLAGNHHFHMESANDIAAHINLFL